MLEDFTVHKQWANKISIDSLIFTITIRCSFKCVVYLSNNPVRYVLLFQITDEGSEV